MEENVWATQIMISNLYDTIKHNVSLHLNNAFSDQEIVKDPTVKESLTVQNENVRRNKLSNNLSAHLCDDARFGCMF